MMKDVSTMSDDRCHWKKMVENRDGIKKGLGTEMTRLRLIPFAL
jgi:hypothetical protein